MSFESCLAEFGRLADTARATVKELEHALSEERATTERQRGEIMRLDAEVNALKVISGGGITPPEIRATTENYSLCKTFAGWYFIAPGEDVVPMERQFWSTSYEANEDAQRHRNGGEPDYVGAYCSVANGWVKGARLRVKHTRGGLKAGMELVYDAIKGDRLTMHSADIPTAQWVWDGRIYGFRWDEMFEVIPDDQYNPERGAEIVSEARRENASSTPYRGPSDGAGSGRWVGQ